jgi:hypothetical protein
MHKVCAYGQTLNPELNIGGAPDTPVINLCNRIKKRKIIYNSSAFPIGTHSGKFSGGMNAPRSGHKK